MPKPTCYMCDEEATSREHVPPATFFPELKDSPEGRDYRRNLITVPSCPQHNSSKSGDDQYLATVIAACIQTNEVAQRLMTPKTLRALRYRPGVIGFFDRLSAIRLGTVETGAFYIDRTRFDRVMDHQARGLYFTHFGQKLTGQVTLHTSDLFLTEHPRAKAHNLQTRSLTDFITSFIAASPGVGENQDVFYYQVMEGSGGKALIRMVFYGGFVVDALASSAHEAQSGDA